MKSKLYFLSILIALFLSACLDPPSYPDEPFIEFMSLSRDTIGEISDTIQVQFSFQDGDGDLGFEDFDTIGCGVCDTACYFAEPAASIIVLDDRTMCVKPFNLTFIPPKGSIDDITGDITLQIGGVFCIPPSGVIGDTIPNGIDTVSYIIYLKDRSGNLSNKITTPPIIIDCN